MKHLGKQANVFSLNFGWKFKNQDISVLPTTKDHEDVYFYAKGAAAGGPAGAAFDDTGWESVDLPHDWVTKNEFTEMGSLNQGYKERGIAWYRIKFHLEEEDIKKQILLEFEGMSCDATIYCNGMLLERNFSGYNSFQVDMTDVANFGIVPNILAVRIDASAWEGWWYEGAGIYRNVWLLKKSPVHIAYNGCFAKPVKKSEDKWSVEVETTFENSFEFDEDGIAITELFDAAGIKVAAAQREVSVHGFCESSIVEELVVEHPHLWSDSDPYLYTVKVTYRSEAGEDYFIADIGFRTIKLCPDTGFWLNDKNIKLKGFCNHQDHAGVGVAVPYAVKEYRVKLLKELGANAYRCAHNTDPEILEICDRLGLLVMEENRTFSSAADNLERVKKLVKNSRNHPSVVLYSVFNEEPLQGTPVGRRIAGKLRAVVLSVDDTRPVLGAFNGGYMEEAGAATILDAVGINYNPARYDEFHAKFPQIPLMGSETASAFMVRGGYETDFSRNIIDNYDSICADWGNTVRDAWRWVQERPFVAGTFVWTGFDYRGEPTPFQWPSVATFFGTYDSCGFAKDACYLYKAFWREEPQLHILPHWNLKVKNGTKVKVMAFTNCSEVALYLNDRFLEQKFCDPYDQVTFEVPYEAGTLRAAGLKEGIKVIEASVSTSKEPYALEIFTSKSEIQEDGFDAVVINVKAVDMDGNVIPDADHLVHFTVTGGGKIIGVGNGDPNSHEPDVAEYRHLFHGYAQAIILNYGCEDVTVKAEANGLKAAETVIKTIKVNTLPKILPVNEHVLSGFKMYYKIFEEFPNPNIEIDKNNMNSFEPVAFMGRTQPEFSKKYGKYGLYRTSILLEKAEVKRSLYFSDVRGKVWIYLGDSLIAKREDSIFGIMDVPLPGDYVGRFDLNIVIQNADEKWPEAGICNPVTIKLEK